MITIGYSTRESKPEFIQYLIKSCGHPKTQIIEKVNNGEKSLSETYNEIIDESVNDIVVLCHDDIYFDTKNWGQKLEKIFERNSDFSIIGVAGTTELPKSGMWWEDRSKMHGIVNHENEGKKWESRYSDASNNLKEVVIVDGVFIALDKTKIKHKFDNTVSGFHFYDVNFCFLNYLENVKIGVTTNIRLTHKSIGMTTNSWEQNRVNFSKKFKKNLPSKVQLSNLKNLNVLIYSDCETTDNSILELTNELHKENNVTFLSSVNNSSVISYITKNKIKFLDVQQSPGFKVGDGKWMIQTDRGPEVTQPNIFYKINEVNLDLIIFDDSKFSHILNNLYPTTDKILYLNNVLNFNSEMTKFENLKKVIFSDETIKNTLSLFNDFPESKITSCNDYETFAKETLSVLNDYEPNSKPKKIKILTGFSDKGGSTTAFVNLTNSLNTAGYDCTLYGPHNWHLEKCKSGLSNQLTIDKNDILICHFVDLPQRLAVDKLILACHEKNLYEVSTKRQFWDTAVFLNDTHRNYHSGYTGDYQIIPNLKENLRPTDKENLDLIAGVIGSIDENKQTHVSIQRALDDGCEKVYVYGGINDRNYFDSFVRPLLSTKVIHRGHVENKQLIYDEIGRVYHSSISECASLVKDECSQTKTKFFGNNATNNDISELTNSEILNKWIELFEI